MKFLAWVFPAAPFGCVDNRNPETPSG